MRSNYEADPVAFPADTYAVAGWRGVAFYVYGWETEPDEETEWSGDEARTGNVVAVMVGDDRQHSVDPSDLTPLEEGEWCRECGQIGCGHA